MWSKLMYLLTLGSTLNIHYLMFRYLQERLKQMEEEKSIAMATVSKYKVCIIEALYHYILAHI